VSGAQARVGGGGRGSAGRRAVSSTMWWRRI